MTVRSDVKVPLSIIVSGTVMFATIVGSAIACTLFITDRIQGVAERSEAKFAQKELVQDLAADVKGIRTDVTAIKESLARNGIDGKGSK